MTSFLIRLIALLLIGVSTVAAADGNGRRIALVIGNGAYQHPELPKLPNPPNDAEDIAKALREFGFEVIERKNQTLEGMNRAIAEFGSRIGGAEAALFYFAGHGIQVKNQNYLIPVNAAIESEASVPYQGINVNQVLEEMDNAKSTANIVMLDACRNNPISGKFRSGASRGLASPGGVPKGTVIVYATDPGNVASDGPGRNGLFTAGLLNAFKGKDLSLDGVLTVASAEVERASQQAQTPYVNGPKTLQKNFLFRASPAPALAPAPLASDIEKTFWTSIEKSSDPADYEAYLKRFPKGNFTPLAENRLNRLKADKSPIVSAEKPKSIEKPAQAAQKPANETASGQTKPFVKLDTKPGAVFRDCAECPDMIVIPTGSFEMGADLTDKEKDNEIPAHKVWIDRAFALGKTEITRRQFNAFVKEAGYAPAGKCWIFKGERKWSLEADHNWRDPDFTQQDSHPVVCITWDDATAYANWLTRKTGKEYRLPTEAEWEYAARAGTATRNYWGKNHDLACDFANVMDSTGKKTVPVEFSGHKCSDDNAYTAPAGSFKPNAFGLYDMIGNVDEWTQDCQNDNYINAPADGSAWLKGDCSKRIRRGGSWYDSGWPNRSASRLPNAKTSASSNTGFRLAVTIR